MRLKTLTRFKNLQTLEILLTPSTTRQPLKEEKFTSKPQPKVSSTTALTLKVSGPVTTLNKGLKDWYKNHNEWRKSQKNWAKRSKKELWKFPFMISMTRSKPWPGFSTTKRGKTQSNSQWPSEQASTEPKSYPSAALPKNTTNIQCANPWPPATVMVPTDTFHWT